MARSAAARPRRPATTGAYSNQLGPCSSPTPARRSPRWPSTPAVGISVLSPATAARRSSSYRRTDGLLIVITETETAIERIKACEDRGLVFADFMRHLADADTSSMTSAFAGKFAPAPEMFALANRSSELFDTFFALIRDTLRPGVVPHDLSAGVRARGRGQVRQPRTHHRAPPPLPGRHPRRPARKRQ